MITLKKKNSKSDFVPDLKLLLEVYASMFHQNTMHTIFIQVQRIAYEFLTFTKALSLRFQTKKGLTRSSIYTVFENQLSE